MRNSNSKRDNCIKIGVIGTGKMGTYHANVLSSLNRYIDFIGVFDINEERTKYIADKYGTNAYSSCDELINDADALCIAVPTNLHYKVAKETLLAGVHTLVEKPIACSIREAEDLVNTAKKNNLIFQVGHVERFKGPVVELKKIVEDPYLIEARRLSPWVDREWDTGVVLDLMIHDIDIVLSLVKSQIKYIDAVGKSVNSDYEDIASAVVQFENGAIANITASRLSETRVRQMSVSQKNAFIRLNFETNDINIYRGSSTSFFVTKKAITYKQDFFVEKVLAQKENALKEEIQHFIDCIIGKACPVVKGEDDIRTLAITLQMIKKIDEKSKRSIIQ